MTFNKFNACPVAVPFSGQYDAFQNAINFSWGEASILRKEQLGIRLLVEILSDENSRTSIYLESTATRHVFHVPVLCRVYYAFLTAYSPKEVIPQTAITNLANPFGMLIP